MTTPRLADLGLVALAGAVVLSLIVGLGHGFRASADRVSEAQLLVVTGGSLPRDVAAQAASALHLRPRVIVHPNAGISRTWVAGEPPLAAAIRVDGTALVDDGTAPLAASRVVVVQGGEADNTATAQELRAAAYHLLDWLQAYAKPGTTIVLVGPIPGVPHAPASMVAVNEVLRAAAADRSVQFVDAVALGLTVGDQRLGGRLTASLRAAGVRG